MNLTAIILAGGKSSRMGTDKGLLLVNGKPMIEYLIDLFNAFQIETIIISNNPVYNQFNVPVYEDLIKDKGPLAGIYTGLSNVETEKNIIVSCDVPGITMKIIDLLIGVSLGEFPTIISYKGKKHPLIGVYPKSIKDKLRDDIDNDRLKVMSSIEEIGVNIIELEHFNIKDVALKLRNINTKGELKFFENGK